MRFLPDVFVLLPLLPPLALVVQACAEGLPPEQARATTQDETAETAETAAAGCHPVRRFTFTSTADVPLGCDQNAPATVLAATVPTTGRAVGRARFSVHHTGTGDTHFWNTRVAIGNGAISYGIGDDVCPGSTSERSNVGFGQLSAGASTATILGYEGSSTCVPGALVVEAGATLDVWVEDGRPECSGKDIAVSDHYTASGLTDTYDWQTNMAPLPGVVATLTTTAPSEMLRVIGVVEGTPRADPNTVCGQEAATLVMQTTLDGAIMSQTTDVVPASQGMGHLVLATTGDQNELRRVTPGVHAAGLLVGSNFTSEVTTGGCCGDGTIALVRVR